MLSCFVPLHFVRFCLAHEPFLSLRLVSHSIYIFFFSSFPPTASDRRQSYCCFSTATLPYRACKENISIDSADINMPQTPPQAPQGRNRSTAVDDSFLLSLLQTPSLISLYKNASYQGTSRSLPVSPERPSASNLDPLSLSLPLPSPVFCSESTPHWSNENPQIRPLPQAQVPPPTEPLPRAEASTSSSSPQKKTPLKPMQSQPFNHPNPLGSNPPQGPATTMEQNPQPTFVPSSAPVSRVQGALQSGNPIQAGMQRRPDDLRQPRQLPLPQRQPDHHVPQGGQQHYWNFPGRV